MGRRTLERCFSILIILLGCYVLSVALHMDWMTEDGPGPGFIPFGIGVLLAFLGAWVFVKARHEKDEECCDKKSFGALMIVMIISSLTIVLADTVGLLIMLGLLAGFLAWFSGATWHKSVITAAVVYVAFFVVFDVFLGSSFPRGFLGF